MSHFEERLERDLSRIRGRVRDLGEMVETAVRNAVTAFLTGNRDLASHTILGDLAVNRANHEIDRLCHAFIARYLPSAGVLRYVSAVLRLNVALERIGDYAETISRSAAHLDARLPGTVTRDVEMMGDQATSILHQAMKAFNEQNADLARGVKGMCGQYAATFDKVFADLVREGEKGRLPIRDLFLILATFNRLERIIHQAKNVCEEAIFAVTGETKDPKRFDILFVDERNADSSLIAEALARKAYPESGSYASAGWNPAEAPVDGLADFGGERGLDLQNARPAALTDLLLSDYDIVVGLSKNSLARLPAVPYHTVLLEWDVEPLGPKPTTEEFEARYRQIASHLAELMETLRGDGAE